MANFSLRYWQRPAATFLVVAGPPVSVSRRPASFGLVRSAGLEKLGPPTGTFRVAGPPPAFGILGRPPRRRVVVASIRIAPPYLEAQVYRPPEGVRAFGNAPSARRVPRTEIGAPARFVEDRRGPPFQTWGRAPRPEVAPRNRLLPLRRPETEEKVAPAFREIRAPRRRLPVRGTFLQPVPASAAAPVVLVPCTEDLLGSFVAISVLSGSFDVEADLGGSHQTLDVLRGSIC